MRVTTVASLKRLLSTYPDDAALVVQDEMANKGSLELESASSKNDKTVVITVTVPGASPGR